ncbi:MAG: macro domain-containing protein [Nitriliruptoraceae bacterium]
MTSAATVDGTRLELVVGDITDQPDLDAVVNAANAQLTVGGGVAGAIHAAAGPELDRACRPLAPIAPGECVATDAFGLPNRRVVHALGPIYGRDEPAEELLASVYRCALARAATEGLASIGFPAISTGAFGYPMRPAAEVALGEVLGALASPSSPRSSLRLVRFVLFSESDLEVHAEVLDSLTPG